MKKIDILVVFTEMELGLIPSSEMKFPKAIFE